MQAACFHRKGELPIAATDFKPYHISKGQTIAQSMAERFDYGQNPDKTQNGELITAYECDHLTADDDFLLTKAKYKAIHAQESKVAAREKAKQVAKDLRDMKLKEAAKKIEDSIEETLAYMDFPYEHWLRIRTNNVIERLNREIRRRTRVVGTFPDGNSALMLVCARLRHVAGTEWGNKKYMNMNHLDTPQPDIDSDVS